MCVTFLQVPRGWFTSLSKHERLTLPLPLFQNIKFKNKNGHLYCEMGNKRENRSPLKHRYTYILSNLMGHLHLSRNAAVKNLT